MIIKARKVFRSVWKVTRIGGRRKKDLLLSKTCPSIFDAVCAYFCLVTVINTTVVYLRESVSSSKIIGFFVE